MSFSNVTSNQQSGLARVEWQSQMYGMKHVTGITSYITFILTLGLITFNIVYCTMKMATVLKVTISDNHVVFQ